MSIPIIKPTQKHPDPAEHPLVESGTSHCGYRGVISTISGANDNMTSHGDDPHMTGTCFTEGTRSGFCGLILALTRSLDHQQSTVSATEGKKQAQRVEVELLKREAGDGQVEKKMQTVVAKSDIHTV
ncbi:MAG: hypothetical protein TREMPRED_004001 [Tremellales sp. Tagirdzhanova-0007]|nr:MAG: hypothetical protein TREMPRED_004001 [Tremellales sp. Tagirdzhanova-0007]